MELEVDTTGYLVLSSSGWVPNVRAGDRANPCYRFVHDGRDLQYAHVAAKHGRILRRLLGPAQRSNHAYRR